MTPKLKEVKHKILVVDDKYGIVSFLNDFFMNKGFDVLLATSGREAIKVAKEERPPIVLLDIKLGWGKDGLEVLKEIREFSPEIRVIMMTAESDDDTIEEAKRLGAEDYIVKPFSLVYLERVVMLKILNLEIRNLGRDLNAG